MSSRAQVSIVSSFVLLALVVVQLRAQTPASCTFTQFNAPNGDIYGFYPNGINHYGVVVGGVFPTQSSEKAFIRYPDGKLSLFAVPGAAWTVLNRRNLYGVSVGAYGSASASVPPGSGSNGLMLTSGSRATLNYPKSPSTTLNGINKWNAIVGTALDANTKMQFGFKYKNGTFTRIQFPGAVQTTATAINNYGVIVGSYQMGSASNPWAGYILQNGTFKTLKSPPGYVPGDINNSGVIVEGNLIRYPDGTVKLVYVPGTAGTSISSINDLGIITGGTTTGTFRFGGYTAKCH
jgi:hypothetical protein